MIEILDITTINGTRHSIDYKYRKTKFNSEEELENYREYLEDKLGIKLYFMKRHLD